MDKNIVALLDATAYTVKVYFKPQEYSSGKKGMQQSQYKYVSNIPGIKVGDWVVVDAPDYDDYGQAYDNAVTSDLDGLKICPFQGVPKLVRVCAVDATCDIEPNADKKYKWIIAKLDLTSYMTTLQRNSQIAGMIAESYKVTMRRSFADSIIGGLEHDKRVALMQLLGNKE